VNSDRIEAIQKACAYPDSQSVASALKQVWNECSQEHGQENENQRKALQIILDMRYCDESLVDAQMIAAMVLNPQDYSLEARQSQGLR